MDRAPPGLKTDRDHLLKDILGCYCPKTFETAKGKRNCGAVGNRTTAIITYPTVIAQSRVVKGREREVVVSVCRSSVAEHWQLKPQPLGSTPCDTTYLSFPLMLQKPSNSNGSDYLQLDVLYRSSDFVSPVHWAPHAVIPLRFFRIQNQVIWFGEEGSLMYCKRSRKANKLYAGYQSACAGLRTGYWGYQRIAVLGNAFVSWL